MDRGALSGRAWSAPAPPCSGKPARDLASWTKQLWHLGNATFACQADAEAALAKALQRLPAWVQVQAAVRAVSKQAKPGRPRKDAVPATQVWQIQATVALDPAAVEAEALRRAAYIIGTNLLDEEAWPDEAVIALYHEQTVAERGFAFLKDPLFLAASVFVKKPERIMAIAFIMVLCLLVYKLAELRVRQRLVATGQTVPDQVAQTLGTPDDALALSVLRGHRSPSHPAARWDLGDRDLAPDRPASPDFTPARTSL